MQRTLTFNNKVGITKYRVQQLGGNGTFYPHSFQLVYCKIGNINYGNKVNLRLLSTNTIPKNPYIIYPVPTKDKLLINAPQNTITNIQIYSLDNKLLLNIIKPNNQVDLSTFNSGIYFLKLSTANNTYTQKIIKE